MRVLLAVSRRLAERIGDHYPRNGADMRQTNVLPAVMHPTSRARDLRNKAVASLRLGSQMIVANTKLKIGVRGATFLAATRTAAFAQHGSHAGGGLLKLLGAIRGEAMAIDRQAMTVYATAHCRWQAAACAISLGRGERILKKSLSGAREEPSFM